jgi:glycerophosphoryl diester phosphodiesterase
VSGASWPYPKVLAHRGGGTLAPENTLAGMRAGLAHGFKGVEFDVMLAADGIPVLMHDPVLGRTVKGEGEVQRFTAAELAAMDAGSWRGPEFSGEPVPGYEAVVAYCRANRLWMNVEIKPAPGAEARTGKGVADATARMFAGAADTQPLFSSFSADALRAARDAAPGIARGMLYTVIPANWREELQGLDCVSLHCSHRTLTPYLVETVKAAGYWVFCYTVNDPERARQLFSWGVDSMCTDRIDLLDPDGDYSR